jgi:hypothetical protein
VKACIRALFILLAACSSSANALAVTPSVAIGTHVLTLGMPESLVLEQLGTDLHLQRLPGSSSSSWLVSKKVGSTYKAIGSVTFDSQRLTTAIRYWVIEDSSSKSLFYAINEATKSLEHDGLTTCQVSTYGANETTDAPSGGGSGSLDTREIFIDCGVKQVKITLSLSDASGMAPSSIEVAEWLQRR